MKKSIKTIIFCFAIATLIISLNLIDSQGYIAYSQQIDGITSEYNLSGFPEKIGENEKEILNIISEATDSDSKIFAHRALMRYYEKIGRFDIAREEYRKVEAAKRGQQYLPENKTFKELMAEYNKTGFPEEWGPEEAELAPIMAYAITDDDRMYAHRAVMKYYEKRGRYDLAREEYRKAEAAKRSQEFVPENKTFKELMAEYNKTGFPEEWGPEELELAPIMAYAITDDDKIYAHRQIAKYYQKHNKYDLANEALKKADLIAHPDYSENTKNTNSFTGKPQTVSDKPKPEKTVNKSTSAKRVTTANKNNNSKTSSNKDLKKQFWKNYYNNRAMDKFYYNNSYKNNYYGQSNYFPR